MSTARTDPRGILLVCQCGNRFLVPHRLAGQRVACTLCGAGLQVPARRSVHQAAADAVDAEQQKAFWRELVEEEGRAPSQEKRPAIQRPEEKTSWWSDPRCRKKVAIGVTGAACLVVLVGIAAIMQRAWGTPAGWSPGSHHSEQGGYAIRLPSGLTARYSSETLGPDPKWRYTFDSVRLADQTRVGVVYMDILTEEALTELSQGVLAFLQRDCLGDVAVIDQCEIRLGRHPGRQMTYEHPTRRQRQSYARWFQVGNRLYGLLWISGYGQPSMPTVVQFLDSFQLLEEPSAEVTLVQAN